MNLTASPWIVRFEPPPRAPKLRLFCFPYAGGGASAFSSWPESLPRGEVDVCAIQPPGRQGRLKEPALRDLGGLVEDLERETRPFRDGAFALFGHSLGALVAFELTRTLRRRGELMPVHLFVSGCAAPQVREPDADVSLSELSDADLVAWLQRFDATPEPVLRAPEMLELVLPTLRADLALREGYRHTPEPPLAVPITALGGVDDRDVDLVALAAWQELTEGRFHLRRFPGGHFFLRTQARDLLATVCAQLGLASAGHGTQPRLPGARHAA